MVKKCKHTRLARDRVGFYDVTSCLDCGEMWRDINEESMLNYEDVLRVAALPTPAPLPVLPTRARGALWVEYGENWHEELKAGNVSAADLRCVPNCGRKTIQGIEEYVIALGYPSIFKESQPVKPSIKDVKDVLCAPFSEIERNHGLALRDKGGRIRIYHVTHKIPGYGHFACYRVGGEGRELLVKRLLSFPSFEKAKEWISARHA